MNIDVFTLFPEWFEWFASQRHVANVLGGGLELQCVNFRDHTPLSGGQVDDTPFGGGAGMVLRVDVLDSALRAHYGVDPVAAAPSQRRVIALAPGGRLLDEQLVERARRRARADAAVRALRGLRRAHPRALRERRRLDRALRASAAASSRRWSCATRCCASCRARSATSTRRREESFSAALEGNPEYPHYTRPAEYRGWRVPEVLLSGHHERIERWRRERSRERGADSSAQGDG